jgi:NitT/TauT family transport system substrate-binding protein
MNRRESLALLGGAASAAAFPAAATAQTEKVRYQFPSAAIVAAFAPFQIALAKGYYRAENLDVEFLSGNGSADVAKQVGAGNVDLGGGVGETPIIVRANGVPVRNVAILGGRSLHKIAYRRDRGINSIKDLKGKTVTVLSYADTSYFALQGVLAKNGLTKNDVNVVAPGSSGVAQLVAAGTADAMCGVPEHVVAIEQTGTPVTVVSCDRYFPSMAQSILASDQIVARRPAAVRGIVRGTLRALADIMRNPAQAVADYIAAVPAHRGEDDVLLKTLTFYAREVYPGQRKLGAIDVARLSTVADFYAGAGIVERRVAVADLYTNQFV